MLIYIVYNNCGCGSNPRNMPETSNIGEVVEGGEGVTGWDYVCRAYCPATGEAIYSKIIHIRVAKVNEKRDYGKREIQRDRENTLIKY